MMILLENKVQQMTHHQKKNQWKNGFLSTVNENGGVVVLDALDQASATVTERLNG